MAFLCMITTVPMLGIHFSFETIHHCPTMNSCTSALIVECLGSQLHVNGFWYLSLVSYMCSYIANCRYRLSISTYIDKTHPNLSTPRWVREINPVTINPCKGRQWLGWNSITLNPRKAGSDWVETQITLKPNSFGFESDLSLELSGITRNSLPIFQIAREKLDSVLLILT